MSARIVINPRFNGFPDIALGGYVGGVLACGRSKCEVILRRPVKTGRPYEMVANPNGTQSLQEGNDVLAIRRDASVDLKAPERVRLEEAKIASKDYVGHRRHLIPTCFNCGPLRSEGDGLRIFPGIVAGRDVVAAPWMPAESLGTQMV